MVLLVIGGGSVALGLETGTGRETGETERDEVDLVIVKKSGAGHVIGGGGAGTEAIRGEGKQMKVCSLGLVVLSWYRDGEGGGGAAAAFAKREEERASERRNHKTKRRKKSNFWDIAPRGFEHISPLQYKAMQGIPYSFLDPIL